MNIKLYNYNSLQNGYFLGRLRTFKNLIQTYYHINIKTSVYNFFFENGISHADQVLCNERSIYMNKSRTFFDMKEFELFNDMFT